MVKHIVMYTLKPEVDKHSAVEIVARSLEPLVGKIPGLLRMEIRSCFQGDSDYCLYSEFESIQALNAYREHPLHLQAKSHFHHFLDTRVAADFLC